jgi:hypothetical protein
MMSRVIKTLVFVGVLALVAGPLIGAEEAISMKRRAQNKLLAQRAARVDAIRKLAERIKGLKITSQTTVKDFVAEDDTIETSLLTHLAGMREVGKPKHLEDGTCEVKMEVTITWVTETLKTIHRRHYKGSKVKITDLESIIRTNNVKVLTETGMGVPRPELEEDPLIVPGPGESTAKFSNASTKARKFWAKYCKAQGRLLAERAARVDAMRRLAERIKGVRIDASTLVKDFVVESDDVNVSMRTFLKGARETGMRFHDDELIVEVVMQVKLRTVYATIKTWAKTHYKGNKVKIDRLEERIFKVKDTVIEETGMGVPREDMLKTPPVVVVTAMAMAKIAPIWIGQTKEVTGYAAVDKTMDNKVQAELMAYRGAELDARRKISEELQGLAITSETSVKNFMTKHDSIRTAMIDYQIGAKVVEDSQKVSGGKAQVTVEIPLRPLWNMILFYQKKLSIKIR